MKKLSLLACVLSVTAVTPAYAHLERDYDSAEPLATTPWYEYMNHKNIAADLDFIEGMRPHHAGALKMAEEYFKSKGGSSVRLQELIHAIIKNQTFEIKVMDHMKDILKAAPKSGEKQLTQVAELGLAQNWKFVHAPSPAYNAQDPFEHDVVSKRDVAFAKGMIAHHEGALTMCHDYLNNPAAVNGYMELLCQDILTSQSQEIALMHDIISEYPGDADKVKPSRIYGMEHMNHSKHKMKGMDMKAMAGHEHHHEGH
ncbi:MAG: DUF305 domain-containing protein [Alphaproteobacteria bacterium]|nr:DUF305 domain-containing protein [Alphaproteobacteria bacterium]